MPTVGLSLTAATVAAIVAQGTPAKEKSIFPEQLNLNAPASSALSVLGVSGSKAVNPANLQDLATNVINSFDENGRLQQGFAITTNLSTLKLAPEYINGKGYFTDARKRLQWGTNLSFAATRGDSDTNPAGRLAIGISFPLIDKTDWRANFDQQAKYNKIFKDAFDEFSAPLTVNLVLDRKTISNLQAKLEDSAAKDDLGKVIAAIDHSNREQTPEALASAKQQISRLTESESNKASLWVTYVTLVVGKQFQAEVDKFTAEWKDGKSWNRRKLDVSFAHSLFANNAQKDSFRSDGTFAWVAFSEPIDKHSKFTAYYRFSNKERSFDTDANAWLVGNGNQIGGAYRYGSSTQTFFLEYLYKDISGTLAKRRRETIWQGGYETKIGGDQWLQVVLGRAEGAATSRNIFGVTLSFNLSPSKQLSVQ
jgi:hypothetical protein